MALDEHMDNLASALLHQLHTVGFAKPFVGLVNEKGDLLGDVWQAEGPTTTEFFMDVARARCVELIEMERASVLVVGICVTLFKTGRPELNKTFGLGGPGHGSQPKNKEAALQITGKESAQGVVVFAADSKSWQAKAYLKDKIEGGAEGFELDPLPKQRIAEGAEILFKGLPWPTAH